MLIQPSQTVRVLKRVPKNLLVLSAESPPDKNDIFYNVEDIPKWLIFLIVFFTYQKDWTQTDHKHELFDK